ncbi:unnamed protein product [Mucor hiemalis]
MSAPFSTTVTTTSLLRDESNSPPTMRNNPLKVTVPSHRFHYPQSIPSSSTSSSSFASYPPLPPPPPMLNANYPLSYSSPPTTTIAHLQQENPFYNWDEYSQIPPPPPPLPNQHILRSHRRWSPESSHPYQRKQEGGSIQKERRHRKQPHELLSESQKKANHIASEQKRRQNIRIGFDQLIDIVPTLNHGNRSEALILQKSVDHIRQLIHAKNELKNQVRDLQGTLGDTNYEDDSSEDELMYNY